MNHILIKVLLLLLLFSYPSFAQKIDTSQVQVGNVLMDSLGKAAKKIVVDTLSKREIIKKKKSDFHFFQDIFGKIDSTKKKKVPKIVMIRSLLVPGWGQATNHQYWLMPIVYAAAYVGSWGLNGNDYYMGFHPFNQRYVYYLGRLHQSYDLVPTIINGVSTTTLQFPNGIETDYSGKKITFTSTQLISIVNKYRQYRDLTYIVFGVGWLLQAVQANVQAHLKSFDMTDNISLRLEPSVQPTLFGSSAIGASIKLTFK